MWGEEGERLKQKRLADREAFRHDLEAQIENNALKRQIQTPEGQLKSTYESMTDGNQNRNQYPLVAQRRAFQPPISSNLVPYQNQNLNRNSYQQANNRVYAPQQNQYQYLHQPLPSTALAPINITITSTKTDVPAVLPRVPHATVIDPSSFSQRVTSVDQMVNNIHNILASTSASENILEGSSIPQLNSQIAQLRSDIEHLASTDVQTSAKRLIESSKSLRNQVESAATQVSNEIAGVRDRITEANAAINQLSTSTQEFSEMLKATSITSKSDLQKHKQLSDTSLQRIESLISRMSKSASETGVLSNAFERSDQAATSLFNTLQASMNGTSSQILKQLSDEIRSASEQRVQTSNVLTSQVHEINQRAANSIQSLNGFVSTLSQSFSQLLQNLSSSISAAIDQTTNDTDQLLSDVINRSDLVLSQSEENFNAVKSEMIQTITEIKDGTVQSLTILEDTLNEENQAQKKNMTEIKEKYNRFNDLISKEIVLQMKTFEEMTKGSERNAMKTISSNSKPIFDKLNPLSENAKRLEEIDSQLTNLEGVMQVMTSQFTESIANLSRNLNDLSEKTKTLKEDLDRGYKECDDKLGVVTDPSLKEDLALREEIHRFSGIFDNELDSKLDDVEDQIKIIMQNIAEITLGYPLNNKTVMPKPSNTSPLPKFEIQNNSVKIDQKVTSNQEKVTSNSENVTDVKVSETTKEIKVESNEQKVVSLMNTAQKLKLPQFESNTQKVIIPEKKKEEKEIEELDEKKEINKEGLMFNPNDFVIDINKKPSENDMKISDEIKEKVDDLDEEEEDEESNLSKTLKLPLQTKKDEINKLDEKEEEEQEEEKDENKEEEDNDEKDNDNDEENEEEDKDEKEEEDKDDDEEEDKEEKVEEEEEKDDDEEDDDENDDDDEEEEKKKKKKGKK
ncbi:hypothetical protein TVAGG3_0460720 [Trichomonas vaginalis G3]|uniref:hypothetical protein n=1 Tax=Trichomonas vaginalis (strain ATCC PRA-98 / G3) TaxID=412133 RepID=UPI0021E5AE81|nr:hypothetical protein TVAGG3_0460720 [Trichomonas vaginalis G3]KAI5514396.1 hypothetical protein TVAGG3_0460720 [Trichomonas vaginalis G3]